MKKDQKQTHDADRRKFLRGSVATGVGVAMSTGLPGVAAAAAEDPQPEQGVEKGYRLTSHVLAYYKTLAG